MKLHFNSTKYFSAQHLTALLVTLKVIPDTELEKFSIVRIQDGIGKIFFDQMP